MIHLKHWKRVSTAYAALIALKASVQLDCSWLYPDSDFLIFYCFGAI